MSIIAGTDDVLYILIPRVQHIIQCIQPRELVRWEFRLAFHIKGPLVQSIST